MAINLLHTETQDVIAVRSKASISPRILIRIMVRPIDFDNEAKLDTAIVWIKAVDDVLSAKGCAQLSIEQGRPQALLGL